MNSSDTMKVAESSSEWIGGMALLGQVVFILLLIIGVILGCAWLFRRLSGQTAASPSLLKVVSSTAVGQRERVVIVEVNQDTWLVLGVAQGQVTKLHELPAQAITQPASSFSERFQQALKKNLGQGQ